MVQLGTTLLNRFNSVLTYVCSLYVALLGAHDSGSSCSCWRPRKASMRWRHYPYPTPGRIVPHITVFIPVSCCLQHCWAPTMLALQLQLLVAEYFIVRCGESPYENILIRSFRPVLSLAALMGAHDAGVPGADRRLQRCVGGPSPYLTVYHRISPYHTISHRILPYLTANFSVDLKYDVSP